jgi:hypothetical protein
MGSARVRDCARASATDGTSREALDREPVRLGHVGRVLCSGGDGDSDGGSRHDGSDRGKPVNIHIDISSAYLWGLATPFMVVGAFYLVAFILVAIYGWYVNH